jgi:RND family efflux transporter MFP subunit
MTVSEKPGFEIRNPKLEIRKKNSGLRFRICGVLGLLALAGCQGPKPAAEEAPLVVSVAQLKPGKALAYEEFTGRTAAIPTVDIKARATGYLQKVLFADGDEVKAGQLLYEIDPRTYAAEVKSAQGNLATTKASLALAEANLDRARRLGPGEAVSKQDFDTYAAQQKQFSAQIISNQGTLERAELNLGFCKVYAPISGTISRSNIQAGNLVTADQTTLTTIVSMDPIYAYFDVDEQTLLRVEQMIREEVSDSGIKKASDYLRQQKLDEETVRQAVWVLQSQLAESKRTRLRQLLRSRLDERQWSDLRALLDANPKFQSYRDTTVPVYLGTRIDKDYPHVGRLDFTDNRLDSTTGTLRVRAVFPNKERILKPDLAVRIRVPLGEPQPALLVSDAAVVSDLDRKFLYVLGDKNEVEQRPVVLGGLSEGMRVLLGGAQEGDWIVVSNLQRVHAGMTVQRKEVPMPRPLAQEDLAAPPPPVVKK